MIRYVFSLFVIIIYLFISYLFYRYVQKSSGRERKLFFIVYVLVTWRYLGLPFDINYFLIDRGIFMEFGHGNILLVIANIICVLIFILFIALVLLKSKKLKRI
jgi:hypothetical protein